MPRPTMPLTPADSTEFSGMEKAQLQPEEGSIKLPPPALAQPAEQKASTTHRPIQPAGGTAYSLPPPPTRSRKIIQMTPKSAALGDPDFVDKPTSKTAAGKTSKANGKATTAGRKQSNSSTTAAGKKIARKTAHSVIERRRRSKMNDEFSTLKDMIPACKGQEMHKLAILQASVDYLRYLQTCITDLKVANNALTTPMIQAKAPKLRPDSLDENLSDGEDEEGDDEDDSAGEPEDEIMRDVEASPNVERSASFRRASRTSADLDQRRASKSSLLPSPAVEANPDRPYSQHSWSNRSLASATTSPTLMANSEQDEEATAALLMLTHDRRHLPSSSQEGGRKGLSVKDLLTH